MCVVITRNSPAVQQNQPSKILFRNFAFKISSNLQLRDMCRKTPDSSKQSLLGRFRIQRHLCSRNATTASLAHEESPSLAVSSSSTLQGTFNAYLLRARLKTSGYSSLSNTIDSGSLDSTIEESESLDIETVVEQWLESVRQRWRQI